MVALVALASALERGECTVGSLRAALIPLPVPVRRIAELARTDSVLVMPAFSASARFFGLLVSTPTRELDGLFLTTSSFVFTGLFDVCCIVLLTGASVSLLLLPLALLFSLLATIRLCLAWLVFVSLGLMAGAAAVLNLGRAFIGAVGFVTAFFLACLAIASSSRFCRSSR